MVVDKPANAVTRIYQNHFRNMRTGSVFLLSVGAHRCNCQNPIDIIRGRSMEFGFLEFFSSSLLSSHICSFEKILT